MNFLKKNLGKNIWLLVWFFILPLCGLFFADAVYAVTFFDSTTNSYATTITCGGTFYMQVPGTGTLRTCVSNVTATNVKCSSYGSEVNIGPLTAPSNAAVGYVIYGVATDSGRGTNPTYVALGPYASYATNCQVPGVCGAAGKTAGTTTSSGLKTYSSRTYPARSTSFNGIFCETGELYTGTTPATWSHTLPSVPSFPTVSGRTKTWYCMGYYVANAWATCTATLSVDGVCGTAATTYPAGSTSSAFSGLTKCALPAANTAPANTLFPTIADPVKTWTCPGFDGGTTSPTCSAVLAPVAANTKTYSAGSVDFSGNMCTTTWGFSPSVLDFPSIASTPTPYATTWTCNGSPNGGVASPTCTAILQVNGVCGSATEVSYGPGVSFPGGSYCTTAGTPTPATSTLANTNGATATWTCPGVNGGDATSCSATRLAAPVDGVCGEAGNITGVNYAQGASFPNGGYCATAGSPTWISSPAGALGSSVGSTATWTCPGANDGLPSGTCLATRLEAPVNGECGNAGSVSGIDYGPGEPFSSDYCATAGSPTWISSPAGALGSSVGSTATWTCPSLRNGSVPTCTANRVATATPPTASGLTANITNCGNLQMSSVLLSWNYVSHSSIPQVSSDYQISTTSNFADGTIVIEGSAWTDSNSDQEYITLDTGGGLSMQHLNFNATYYWRVKTLDENGAISTNWQNGPSFITPIHAYPYAAINVTPTVSIVKTKTCLDANYSACYGANGICTYSWILDNNYSPNTNKSATPPCHTYQSIGVFNEKLTVTDEDGFSCDVTYALNVKNSLDVPQWKEISPF